MRHYKGEAKCVRSYSWQNWPAALRRAQRIVDLLRNGYHGEGEHRWQLDETIAEKALAYYAAKARNPDAKPRNDKFDASIALAAGTGQSLDWILVGDPSLMITALSEAPRRSLCARAHDLV